MSKFRRSRHDRWRWLKQFGFNLHSLPSRIFNRVRPATRGLGQSYQSFHNVFFDLTEKRLRGTDGEIQTRKVPQLRSYLDPGFTIAELFRFVVRWVKTRQWLSLAQAAPALIVGLVVPYAIVQFGATSRTERAVVYQAEVARLLDAEEYSKAEILLRELRELDPANVRNQYLQATTAELKGDSERAVRIMTRLAVDNNFSHAHRWLASRHWMSFKGGDRDNGLKDRITFHTAALLKMNPDDKEANRLMGTLMLENGNHEQAVPYLRAVADEDATASLRIAESFYRRGDRERAREYALTARALIKKTLHTNPNEIQPYRQLAKAYMLAENEESGIRIIAAAYKETNQPILRSAISDLYFAWGNRELIEESPIQPATFKRALGHFKNSLRANPQNLNVANRLADFSLKLKGEEGEQIAEFLSEALTEGLEPAIVHFLHGTRALLDGDSQTAEFHLKRALSEDPNTPGVLNNIAMTLVMKTTDVDSSVSVVKTLEEALQLVDTALAMDPGHPYINDTRGQVLLKLGRYEESISNFEVALSDEQLRPAVYPFIASAYRAMGQHKLADQFDQKAGARLEDN